MRVLEVTIDWWGGRDLRAMLPQLLFEHFRSAVRSSSTRASSSASSSGSTARTTPARPSCTSAAFIPRGVGWVWPRSVPPVLRRARAHGPHGGARRHDAGDEGSVGFHLGLGFAVLAGVPVTREPGSAVSPWCTSSCRSTRTPLSWTGPACLLRRRPPVSGHDVKASSLPPPRRPATSATPKLSSCSTAATCWASVRAQTPYVAVSTRRRRHLHRRPQHQLHRLLHLRLPLLRLLQEKPGSGEGYSARRGGHPPQGRGDPGPRRHSHHDAGRAAPGPGHPLVRGRSSAVSRRATPSTSTRSRRLRSCTSPR